MSPSIISCHDVACQKTIVFFFFNDTATTEIYTLSLHDALPIYFETARLPAARHETDRRAAERRGEVRPRRRGRTRSEEHTSELQSQSNLVCRLLLEKKKNISPELIRAHVCPPAHCTIETPVTPL